MNYFVDTPLPIRELLLKTLKADTPRLLSVALLSTNRKEDAEDIVADIRLKVLMMREETLMRIGCPRAYLRGMTRNAAEDWRKRYRGFVPIETIIALGKEQADEALPPQWNDYLSVQEIVSKVKERVCQTKEEFAIYECRYERRQECAEIAVSQGVSARCIYGVLNRMRMRWARKNADFSDWS